MKVKGGAGMRSHPRMGAEGQHSWARPYLGNPLSRRSSSRRRPQWLAVLTQVDHGGGPVARA